MPEENKYTTTDEEVSKNMTDEECISSGNTDAEPLAETETSSDTISYDISANAPVEDIFDDSSPLSHISEDGDQLTLSIPLENDTADDADDGNAEPSDDAEDFASSLLKEAPPYDVKKTRKIDGRFDFIELLIFTLTVVFVMTSFVFRHSIVDGNSMQNTLQDGEILIISGLFYTPERYDIVVLEDHSTGIYHPIVKRVIAVGGDEVCITKETIYVNGEPVRDDFVLIDNCKETFMGYSPEIFTVPEGQIYVLGDHRDNSIDSRYFGVVDADSVIGKVLLRLYPFDRFGSVYGGAEE